MINNNIYITSNISENQFNNNNNNNDNDYNIIENQNLLDQISHDVGYMVDVCHNPFNIIDDLLRENYSYLKILDFLDAFYEKIASHLRRNGEFNIEEDNEQLILINSLINVYEELYQTQS